MHEEWCTRSSTRTIMSLRCCYCLWIALALLLVTDFAVVAAFRPTTPRRDKTRLTSSCRLWLSRGYGSDDKTGLNGTTGRLPPTQRQTPDENECPVKPSPKSVVPKRKPPFPAEAYSLAAEEEQFVHNYVSFIDQSILQSYSQQTRLIEPRRYALPDQFLKKNADKPPTIDDVAMPKTNYDSIAIFFAWSGLPARMVVGSASYLAFPYIISFLQEAITGVDHSELSKLIDSFLPGVAIVLGTYYSLTISILYDRFARLQEAVNTEAATLSLTLENLVHLLEDDEEAVVQGAQCIADQVRALVFDSRGRETMRVIYGDPYARILRLLKELDKDECRDGYLLADIHGAVSQLYRLRSDRLTVESLALAPTHFDVMTFLSGMLLLGFAMGTLATAPNGIPNEVARVLFAGLVVCYTIFYEMSFDLNRPFDGIYQIRRSGAAMHFLHIKHVINNHPALKGRVDFEEMVDREPLIDDCDGECQSRRSQIWYN